MYNLNEENRFKTTYVLEELIGELPNFIMTSVLLQGNYGTFKSKDNREKKEYLCRILDIDYFSDYEKEITEHYKSLKN